MQNVIIVYDDGENEKLYFTKWVKYRKDTPEKLKELFEKTGTKEGESVPFFCNDPDEALCFVDSGMAMQVMRKIQEMYPEWKEKLYSILHKYRHGATAEERMLNAMFREAPEDNNGAD